VVSDLLDSTLDEFSANFQRGALMNKNNFSLLTGFAIGAAFMYAFDPGGGRRRRALAKDQFTRLAHKTRDGLDAAARDSSNRVAGSVAKVRRRFRSDEPEDDVLVERVRAELGRIVSHPKAIDVEARQGTIRLCGSILTHEVNSLVRAVESVPGVRNVDNQLEPHDQPGNIPSLQGSAAD
jgi:BON domain